MSISEREIWESFDGEQRRSRNEMGYQQGRCHREPPSRIDIASATRQSFSHFLPRGTRIHLCALPPSPPPLPFVPSSPLSCRSPSILYPPSVPAFDPCTISVFHFLPPRSGAVRARCSAPRVVAASVCFALARVSVFTYACICTPRALLRGCVGRVNSGESAGQNGRG